MSAPTVLERRRRVVTETGITLPYRKRKYEPFVPGRPPAGKVFEEGVVFVGYDFLEALSEQGTWDSQFGNVLLCHDDRIEAALEAIGFLVKETKGGVHGTDELKAWLDNVEFPEEPQEPAGDPLSVLQRYQVSQIGPDELTRARARLAAHVSGIDADTLLAYVMTDLGVTVALP